MLKDRVKWKLSENLQLFVLQQLYCKFSNAVKSVFLLSSIVSCLNKLNICDQNKVSGDPDYLTSFGYLEIYVYLALKNPSILTSLNILGYMLIFFSATSKGWELNSPIINKQTGFFSSSF